MQTCTESHKEKVRVQKLLVHKVFRLVVKMIKAQNRNNIKKWRELWQQIRDLFPESS